MSLKRLITTVAAAAALSLSGAPSAQSPVDEAAAATEPVQADPAQGDLLTREAAGAEAEAVQAVQAAQAAEEYKLMKMNEATTADDTFHANRTEANMIARDKAEAEATEAVKEAHAAQDRANAAKDRAKAAMERVNAAMEGEATADSPR